VAKQEQQDFENAFKKVDERHAAMANTAIHGKASKEHMKALEDTLRGHMNVTALMCCHSWVGLTARMRRACDVVCLWPPTLGGADQTSYIARSIGIGKPELESAFAECRNKYECVCIYTDPPPGRSTFMINMSRPFDPHDAAGAEDYYAY
jgi:hypothetical protein